MPALRSLHRSAAPSAARAFFACALAAVLAAAAAQGQEEPGARRLNGAVGQQIWGWCPVLWAARGCFLGGGYSCSSRPSDGPEDADLEIRLGNLPPSTDFYDRHLAWWAAYESASAWDPLASYANASVYGAVADAYPRFDDPEFNGGNVRISGEGVATIRVRTPSAYLVDPLLAVPHIHLRVCEEGEFPSGSIMSFAYDFDHVYLDNGEIRVETNSQWTPVEVRSVVAIESEEDPPAGYSLPEAPYYVESIAEDAVQLAARASGEMLTAVPTGAGAPDPLIEAIESAVSIIDASVLEFSPIYQCFVGGSYFSHFDDGCTAECPAASELAHGQCVKETVQQSFASFDATWKLKAYCSDDDFGAAALHRVRIAAAGHMDVPFQEVDNVTLRLLAANATGGGGGGRRRLSSSSQEEARTLLLSVALTTRRHGSEQGSELLRGLLNGGTEAAAALLKVSVEEVALFSGSAGDLSGDSGDWVVIDSSSDPYEPPYDELLPSAASGSQTEQEDFPWEVILVIALCAACLGITACLVVRGIWYGRCSTPGTVAAKTPEAAEAAKAQQT